MQEVMLYPSPHATLKSQFLVYYMMDMCTHPHTHKVTHSDPGDIQRSSDLNNFFFSIHTDLLHILKELSYINLFNRTSAESEQF